MTGLATNVGVVQCKTRRESLPVGQYIHAMKRLEEGNGLTGMRGFESDLLAVKMARRNNGVV
jgi:hypothetical protein